MHHRPREEAAMERRCRAARGGSWTSAKCGLFGLALFASLAPYGSDVWAHDGAGANVGFVVAENGLFYLKDGDVYLQRDTNQAPVPFRFVGTNAYFMHDAYASDNRPQPTMGTLCLAGGGHLPDTKDAAGNPVDFPCEKSGVPDDGLGFPVIRTFIFRDGAPVRNDGVACSLQPRVVPDPDRPGFVKGDYDETCFRKLDWVLHQADRAGIRLIATFLNNWDTWGGISQYLRWCDSGGLGKVAFYTTERCKHIYKKYVEHVLTRRNVYNDPQYADREYRDDPTIFAWELANEARCNECVSRDLAMGQFKGYTVAQWVNEMATYIKTLDPNHMVTTGEEGFDCTKTGTATAVGYTDPGLIRLRGWMYDGSQGTCFTENLRFAAIDFASIHLWPHHWGVDRDSAITWIKDHIRIAKGAAGLYRGQAAKPFVLGEFGWNRRQSRAGMFNEWLDAVERSEALPGDPNAAGYRGDGALAWQIICDYDAASCGTYATQLEVLYPPDSDVSRVLKCHAAIANSPAADVQTPCP
jgi:endo-1,4-beta-mannosidase